MIPRVNLELLITQLSPGSLPVDLGSFTLEFLTIRDLRLFLPASIACVVYLYVRGRNAKLRWQDDRDKARLTRLVPCAALDCNSWVRPVVKEDGSIVFPTCGIPHFTTL